MLLDVYIPPPVCLVSLITSDSQNALSNIYKVKIKGLASVNCAKPGSFGTHFTTYYGLHLQSVQTAEIIDCTFQDSYSSALRVVDSHVVLRGTSFGVISLPLAVAFSFVTQHILVEGSMQILKVILALVKHYFYQ